MNNHSMPFLGIVAESIVLVMAIVSLSVFATLTLSSANGDYILSKKNLERTTHYYQASNEANKTLGQIDQQLWKVYYKSKNKKDYIKKVSKTFSKFEDITYNKKKQTAQFQKNITDKQQINVKIKICYPKRSKDNCYKILCFKNEAVGEWKMDQSLPVYQTK